MPIETNLNRTPFFDDYDETKNYHRVLFRPSVPVQARELTQLQTILQNQIERFGQHVFVEGTIVKGCSFTHDSEFYYVKLLDLTLDGLDVNLPLYSSNGVIIDDSTNLTASIIHFEQGLQTSSTGNFNTLYFKYLNVGNAGQTTFSNNSILTIYNSARRVEQVTVSEPGSGYSNGDVVDFTSTTGTGATAYVITYANSGLKEVILTSKGSGYLTAPAVSVNASSLGTGGVLQARHFVDKVTVPSNTFSDGVGAPVGRGFASTITDGIIFQKGHFIRVDPQLAVVSKYTTQPNNVVLGFSTIETIANTSIDTSLNDNAAGFSNESAPGAFRLKLTPRLLCLTKAEAAANSEFFSLVEFENGVITKQRQQSEYQELNREFARRTYEESGNYAVNQFVISTEAHPSNANSLNVAIGPGLAYVDGNRAETLGTVRLPINKANTTTTIDNVSVSATMGNYVYVREYKGVPILQNNIQVELRDTAASAISTGSSMDSIPTPGNIIGTAYVRGIDYDRGSPPGASDTVYRVYLHNIVMNSGKSFANVRSLRKANDLIGDVVTETKGSGATVAVLYDASLASGLFDPGIRAVQSMAATNFLTRRHTTVTIGTNGTGSINAVDSYFPYALGSTLTSTQERQLIISPSSAVAGGSIGGTISYTGGSVGANVAVTGIGTSFLTELVVGDYIRVNSSFTAQVTGITSESSMQVRLGSGAGSSVSSVSATRWFPADTPVSFERATATLVMDGTSNTILNVNLGTTLASSTTFDVLYNAYPSTATVRNKTINRNQYVKIAASYLASDTTWSLGLVDVHKLVAVYKTSSTGVYDTATDITSHIVLDNGQRDTQYKFASITKKAGSPITIDNTTNLVVVVDVFTNTSGIYSTINSYPVAATNTLSTIAWADMPIYTLSNGVVKQLRNVIDARLLATNYSQVTGVLGSATVITSAPTESYPSTIFPAADCEFQADVSMFLGRRDRVIVQGRGDLTVLSGQPDVAGQAVVPATPPNAMSLAIIDVPPYPSLPPSSGYALPEYTCNVTSYQNKRYTMKDIESLDKKIAQLQYYSLLSTLETQTRDANLPSENNLAVQRFKNGFIVDPLINYNLADITNPEFKTSIDIYRGVATPTFEQERVALKVSNTTNMTVMSNDTAILSYNHKELLSQPIATKHRNPVESFWKYNGKLFLTKQFDNFVSTTQNPTSIDLGSALNSVIAATEDALNKIPVNTTVAVAVDVSTGSSSSTSNWSNGTQGGVATTTTNTETTTVAATTTQTYANWKLGVAAVPTQVVGDFVTDISFSPFMKGTMIGIYAVGLRPGARHYVYFDAQSVDAYVEPATLSGSSSDETKYTTTGVKGAPLVANANGEVAAKFYLPDNTFYVGSRELIVCDSDNYASISSTTSKATIQYNAYNTSISKSELSVLGTSGQTASMITRGSVVSSQSVASDTIVASSTTSRRITWDNSGDGGGGDPLAQSFLITNEMARNGVGLFLTKLDLYFKQKDSTRGVTFELRTVELGIPTRVVLSSVHLDSAQINISNNASVATTITFPRPVFLKADEEYAVVVMPDANNPNYLIWTGAAGGTDITNTNLLKNQDWNQGAMFLSTNASTWTPIQDEDIKFKAYYAEFSSASGAVDLCNDDLEFLTISGLSGYFSNGELVGQPYGAHTNRFANNTTAGSTTIPLNTPSGYTATSLVPTNKVLIVHDTRGAVNDAGTVAVSAGANTVTGSGTNFTSLFAPGNLIVVDNQILRRVTSVSNSTFMTVDAAFLATASGLNYHEITSPVYTVANVVSTGVNSIVIDRALSQGSNTTHKSYIERVVGGVVEQTSQLGAKLYLNGSSAEDASNHLFKVGRYVIGSSSNASAVIASVDDVKISHLDPMVTTVLLPGTIASPSIKILSAANTLISHGALPPGETKFLRTDSKVRSRSNEWVFGSGDKSLQINLAVVADQPTISPAIETKPACIVRYNYTINNSISGETTRNGNSTAKYISKQIVLADGQDAEDLKVYVSAYRPVGTEIYVYARFLNATDSDLSTTKDWTLLTLESPSTNVRGSDKEESFTEYTYKIDSQPPNTQLAGVRVSTTTSSAVMLTSTSLVSSLAADDVVTISHPSTSKPITRVVQSVNSTAVTVSSVFDFTSTDRIIAKATSPKAAFKNYDTNGLGVVRYVGGPSYSFYDGYKSVALKVVLTSNTATLVPKLQSIRAICCSV